MMTFRDFINIRNYYLTKKNKFQNRLPKFCGEKNSLSDKKKDF